MMAAVEVNEWPVVTLGNVASVYSGGTPSRAVPAYWGGAIPWITTTEIDFGRISSARQTITEMGLERSAARIAPAGTVLLAMYGQGKTRGKSAILDIPASMNQACAAIETRSRLDAGYLLHYLTAHYSEIRAMSNSGSQENLSGELVRKIEILLPSIDEQRRIACALADADALTTSLEALNAKKRAIKQGMMQELLTGRARLVSDGETWARVSLGATGLISAGGADKKIRPDEPKVHLLNYMDVYRNEFVDSSMVWQEVSAPAGRIAKCSVRAGDVFFTPTSETPDDIARSAVAPEGIRNAVYSYHLVRWRPDKNWDPMYLAYAFETPDFRAQVSTLAAGSGTRYVVSIPGFRGLEIPQPNLGEQRAIARILRAASDEIAALERRLEATRAIKQGMMQELLTGRTRLVPTEVVA